MYFNAFTFNEAKCESLIGTQLPGSIQKVSCKPFEYTVEKTGEVIVLDYHWEYLQEGDSVEEIVMEEEVVEQEDEIKEIV